MAMKLREYRLVTVQGDSIHFSKGQWSLCKQHALKVKPYTFTVGWNLGNMHAIQAAATNALHTDCVWQRA